MLHTRFIKIKFLTPPIAALKALGQKGKQYSPFSAELLPGRSDT
jgi:hypothetical protein